MSEDRNSIRKIDFDEVEGVETLALRVNGSVEVELEEKLEDKTENKAKRFVELVKGGKTPGIAADLIGTTLKNINSDLEMKDAVQKLLTTASLSGKIRQEMVKAGLNKMFMEGVEGDIKQRKIALEAAKLISSSEGLQTPQEVGVTIDFGTLAPVIKDLSLPGITLKVEEISDEKTH
jgi:hypothetical protein